MKLAASMAPTLVGCRGACGSDMDPLHAADVRLAARMIRVTLVG